MPRVKPKVILLAHTPEPEKLIATAARLCYSRTDLEGLLSEMETKEVSKFIRMLKERGHLSTFEHASFTFAIEGISRACSHQLVRHRLASFSQASQRYIDMTKTDVKDGEGQSDLNYICPDSIAKDRDGQFFDIAMQDSFDVYKSLKERNVNPEDARFVLPNACETKIMVTMNCRELLHFFDLRTDIHAQWEIREVANIMLSICKEKAPNVFNCTGHTYWEYPMEKEDILAYLERARRYIFEYTGINDMSNFHSKLSSLSLDFDKQSGYYIEVLYIKNNCSCDIYLVFVHKNGGIKFLSKIQ